MHIMFIIIKTLSYYVFIPYVLLYCFEKKRLKYVIFQIKIVNLKDLGVILVEYNFLSTLNAFFIVKFCII